MVAPDRGGTLSGAIGIALALAAVLAAEASAITPDPAEMERLRLALSNATSVRVTGTFGVQVIRDVRLDSTGISSARWGPGAGARPALIVGAGIAPPPTPPPLAWSQISTIETGRTRIGRAVMGGAILGAVLGVAVWKTIPLGYDGASGPPLIVIGTPTAGGILLGLLLGSHSYEWRPVYRRETLSER